MTPDPIHEPVPDHFRQLTLSAGVLAAVAGYVNASTIVGAMHSPSTHMSGVATHFSVDLVSARGTPTFWLDVVVLLAFVGGSAVSGAVLDSTQLRVGRRYGLLLLIESGLLTIAWYFVGHGSWVHLPLIAVAAGLQNALATQYSRAIVRTTHMTGILTDLGIAFGKWLARRGVTHWRVFLYLSILGGFLVGGVGGTAMSIVSHEHALLPPIALTGIGGAAYWAWQHRLRVLAATR